MEERHREIILKNKNKLLESTNYDNLITACLQDGLLTRPMISEIESTLETNSYHENLLRKITRRGPKAYALFKYILNRLECYEALNILNQADNLDTIYHSTSGSQHVPTTKIELEEYKDEVENIEMKLSEKLATDDIVGVYPMKTKDNRGIVFIVNIMNFPSDKKRDGATNDSERLLKLFKKLGFRLFHYFDLTRNQFRDLLDKLIKSNWAKETECFFMVLMTHGNKAGTIESVRFADGKEMGVAEIEDMFKNTTCLNLNNKPKILMFQCCRGNVSDKGITNENIQTDSMVIDLPKSLMPSISDTLVCFATSRGYTAHRSTKDGSWYIQTFCKVMTDHAHHLDFGTIIQKVQHETSQVQSTDLIKSVQMGNNHNYGFNKKLFFNPGYWEGKESTEENGNDKEERS